jgi:hypothetical protein
MSSLKGKADLFRTGKNGAGSPRVRNEIAGGGDDFAKTSRVSQGEKYRKNPVSSVDNQGVFANSTAGLAKKDKAFLPNPGTGRDGLDMYSIKSGRNEEYYGLDMARQRPKEDSEF